MAEPPRARGSFARRAASSDSLELDRAPASPRPLAFARVRSRARRRRRGVRRIPRSSADRVPHTATTPARDRVESRRIMSAFPIVVPERAPTTVHVAKANAADVAERARTTETTTHASFPSSRPGRGPAELEDEREHEGEDEAFTRKRGAFAKDCAW